MCGRDGLGVGGGGVPTGVCVASPSHPVGKCSNTGIHPRHQSNTSRRVWWIQVSASVLASDLTSTTDPADIQEVTPVSGQFSGRIIGSLWEDGSLEEFVVTPDRRSDDQP